MTIPASRAQLEHLRAQYGPGVCFFSEYYNISPVSTVDYAVPAKRVRVAASGAGNLVVRLLGDTADTIIQVDSESDITDLAIVRIVAPATTARLFTVFW
jgi:hypothetical protein